MMITGMLVVFCFSFVIFPGFLMLFTPGEPQRRRDYTSRITGAWATWVERSPASIALAFAALAVFSIVGITQLEVENRFIDYFKGSTEIYQGMEVIDRELGGTTPLDVILDADPAFFSSEGESVLTFDEEIDDEFSDIDDEFMDEFDADAGQDLGATSYWYNTFQLDTTVRQVHEYLEGLPETGKVLSMATTIETLQILNQDETPGTFFLSLLYKRLPSDIKEALFDPYMSEDGNQVRFWVRVYETDPDLRRDALIEKIKQGLVESLGIQPERVHLTGMLVLYNNVLQSLFRSQMLTIGVVFVGILIMFLVLFRSMKIALVTVVPIMIAAASVPGVMGWFGIPLDIMTITIAAISIGIGVDDAIHYVHRFREEFARDGDYSAAIRRSHLSIGRAIYFTSVIIVAGFSILSLSSFIPTILFGLLTGFSMLIALVANLTLLPVLLRLTRAS
jgi:predicted RND superfamily exporter protein